MADPTEMLELWDYPDPFVIATRVVKEDIDSFGHVNNPVYLRWITECAWAHSAHVGLSEQTCVRLRRGMAVRSVHLEMIAAAYLDEDLLIGNWLSACTRLRATRVYQILRPSTSTTLLRGHVNFVCLNLDTGRPARMPEAFVAGYAVNPTSTFNEYAND